MVSLLEKIRNNANYIIGSIIVFIIIGAIYREFFTFKTPSPITPAFLFSEGLNATEKSGEITFTFNIGRSNFSFAEYRDKSCKNPYALVLVVDMSDSMAAGKLPIALESSKVFLDKSNNRDYVGILTFGSDSYVVHKLISMEEAWKVNLYRMLDDVVNQRTGAISTSSTCISCALEKAYEALQASPKGKDKRIILISDGIANEGLTEIGSLSNVSRLALEDEDIRTTTIGVNPSCNDALLRSVANAGNGNYYINDGSANISAFFHDEFENITKTPLNSFYFVYRKDLLEDLRIETQLKQTKMEREQLHDIINREMNNINVYENVDNKDDSNKKKEKHGIFRKEREVDGVSVSVSDIREVRNITIKGSINIDNYKKEQGNIYFPHYMEVGYFVFSSSLHCDDEADNVKLNYIPFRVLLKNDPDDESNNILKCNKKYDREKFMMCYSTYRNSIIGGCDPEKAVSSIPHCKYILPNCTEYFNSLLKTNLDLEDENDFDCKKFLLLNNNKKNEEL